MISNWSDRACVLVHCKAQRCYLVHISKPCSGSLLRGLEVVGLHSSFVIMRVFATGLVLQLLFCSHGWLCCFKFLTSQDLTITQCTADPKCAGAVALTCGMFGWVVVNFKHSALATYDSDELGNLTGLHFVSTCVRLCAFAIMFCFCSLLFLSS